MSPRKAAALRGGDRSLHDHLVAAAQRLLEHHSPAKITVRAIAGEAQVASGVLYNHFTDKDELLVEALIARIRDVAGCGWFGGQAPGSLAGTGTVEGNLQRLIGAMVDTYFQVMPIVFGLLSEPKLFHQLLWALPAATFPDGLYRPLAGYLRAEQQIGRVAPDTDPDAAAHLILGACHDLVMNRMAAMIHSAPEPVPSSGSASPTTPTPGHVFDTTPTSTADLHALVATLLRGLTPDPARPDGTGPDGPR